MLWSCPSCGTENRIEETACSACGTPFRRLFDDAEETRAAPSTERAVGLSLALPGAGHIASGRVGEGVARAVVFAYALGTGLSVLVARGGRGLGPFLPLVALLMAAAAILYGITVADARRLARGEPQLLTTRMLLYGATGLIVLTVLVLVLSGMRVTRL